MALGQNIVSNFSTLLRCLDPSNELLGRLLSVASVRDQIPFIKQQATLNNKNDALLTALRQVPDNLQESVMNDLIAALRSCGQEHVANIFRRESDKVPMSDEHRDMITTQTDKVLQFLDPGDGLLNKLLSSKVINWAENDTICSKVGFDVMARELICTILRKSDDAFQILIDCLIETGQTHVVYVLTGEGDNPPLCEDDRRKLREKRDDLVRNITPYNLMSALISNGVFTSYDEQRIEGCKTFDEKAEMMLNLIARKSQAAYDRFVETLGLPDCHHEHVRVLLLGPEVAATADVIVEEPVVDVQDLEGEIREDMLRLAQDETELKKEMEKNGISVSKVLDSSIIVKFRCEDYAALIALQKLHRSKKLDQLFTDAFRPKFAEKGLKFLRIVISEEEFQRHFDLKLVTDDHRNVLKSLAEHCFDKVSVTDEFLDKLSLRRRCREVVKAQATHEQQVKTLLDIMSRQPDSAFTRLLNALDDTQQTEAASYLRSFEEERVAEISETSELISAKKQIFERTGSEAAKLERTGKIKRKYAERGDLLMHQLRTEQHEREKYQLTVQGRIDLEPQLKKPKYESNVRLSHINRNLNQYLEKLVKFLKKLRQEEAELENMATPNVIAQFRSETQDSVAVVRQQKELGHTRELLRRTEEEFDWDVSTSVSRLCCFVVDRACNIVYSTYTMQNKSSS